MADALAPWILDYSELEFTMKLGEKGDSTSFRGMLFENVVSIKAFEHPLQPANEELRKELSFWLSFHNPYLTRFWGVIFQPIFAVVSEFGFYGSLLRRMKLSEPIGWDFCFTVLTDTANGIQVLHHHNPILTHKRLHPGNVVLGADWRCKLTDCVSLPQLSPELSPKETFLSLVHVPPELIQNSTFTSAGDIYSFGMLIWQLLTRMFTGTFSFPFQVLDVNQPQKLIEAIQKGFRPTLEGSIPLKFKELVELCWNQEEHKRPSILVCSEKILLLQDEYCSHQQTWDDELELSLQAFRSEPS